MENAKFLTNHKDQKKEIEDITNSALSEELGCGIIYRSGLI